MAINNAPLVGVNIGVTTPAMFGAIPDRYSLIRDGDTSMPQIDQAYSAALTRRLAESAATATEILTRRNAEERLTGPRLGASTDEPMWRIRMADISEPGFGFCSAGTSEDFGYPIDNATTRAQIAEFERHRVQTQRIPITTPGESAGLWGLPDDGPTRRMVMMQEAEQALPELRAVRTGLTGQVTAPIRNTISTPGSIGELLSSAILAKKHLPQQDPQPSEDLEDLREDHGLRIEELEDQVRALTERLEQLEQSILL